MSDLHITVEGGTSKRLKVAGTMPRKNVVVTATKVAPDGYIQPSGILVVTENGEYDVTRYAKVDVDVPIPQDSDVPPEIATEAEMTVLLDTAAVGSVYKYVGETTDKYENGVMYIVEE